MKERRATEQTGANAADRQLLTRFMEGENEAFRQLFRRHTPRLRAYCTKMVRDRQAADDIVQDLWERVIAFRREDRSIPDSPIALFIRIARNLCLNYLERARRAPSSAASPLLEAHGSRESEMSDHELAVIAALERLPVEQRDTLMLHVYAGYSYEEIAEMNGEPAGAVRMRAWRARMKLARMIAATFDVSIEGEGDEQQQSAEDLR